jgi:hypothetical protein
MSRLIMARYSPTHYNRPVGFDTAADCGGCGV